MTSNLWKPIEEYINKLSNNSSMPAVHHYTNVKGALGILENGRIWFTERAHLNDPSEVSCKIRRNPDGCSDVMSDGDSDLKPDGVPILIRTDFGRA